MANQAHLVERKSDIYFVIAEDPEDAIAKYAAALGEPGNRFKAKDIAHECTVHRVPHLARIGMVKDGVMRLFYENMIPETRSTPT